MKITFAYSNLANLKDKTNTIMRNNFELPDTILQLPDCYERVMEIASLVGKLTYAVLHLSSKELDLKAFLIRHYLDESAHSVTASVRITILRFERGNGRRREKRDMKIILPVTCPIPNLSPQILGTHMLQFQPESTDKHVLEYLSTVNDLATNVLMLLNSEPLVGSARLWEIVGFSPYWSDNSMVNRANKAIRRHIRRMRTEEKKPEKQRRKTRNGLNTP